MYHPFKQYVKRTFPTFFYKARDIKDQTIIELQTLRQVGIRSLFKRFLDTKEKWKKELPLQKICREKISHKSLADFQKACGTPQEGGHALYFAPGTFEQNLSLNVLQYIPIPVGLKIVKRPGGLSAPFAAADKTGAFHSAFSPSHQDLLLVHGMFFNRGLGPRLYDVVELEFSDGSLHVAYVLEHIEGTISPQKECESFIEKIKALEKDNLIKLVNWNGYGDDDFLCPRCNGNLIFDSHNKTSKYIDLQNFALDDYSSYLKDVALMATKASHFGQRSYLMGGEYLYQEVPGLNMPAKRSPIVRFEVFKKLLEKSHLTLKDKLVIDIGCNLGLMSAQYLKAEAAWIHGFDMPNVTPSTEQVLLSVGCTRFSTSGLLLSDTISLIQNMPSKIREALPGCVVSYLAIRGHIGWIKELKEIPWSFMLYEGHQEEGLEMSHRFVEEFQKIKKCHIVAEGWIDDANSSPRYVAIIKAQTIL